MSPTSVLHFRMLELPVNTMTPGLGGFARSAASKRAISASHNPVFFLDQNTISPPRKAPHEVQQRDNAPSSSIPPFPLFFVFRLSVEFALVRRSLPGQSRAVKFHLGRALQFPLTMRDDSAGFCQELRPCQGGKK